MARHHDRHPVAGSLLLGGAGRDRVRDVRRCERAQPGPLFAFGFALIPFVFLALAILSEHPRAPGAVVKAMTLAIVVGIPVSATTDAVTGLVAGIGAGGVSSLRADVDHNWKFRAIAVIAATAYVFFLLCTAGEVALLLAPILPFTSIGVADHLSERRRERARREAESRRPRHPPLGSSHGGWLRPARAGRRQAGRDRYGRWRGRLRRR